MVYGEEDSMSRPNTILFYVPHLGGGGAEKHAARLIAGLVDRGFAVDVAVNGLRGGYEAIIPMQARIIRLGSKDYKSSLVSLLMAIPRLARTITHEKPEIICPVMLSSGAVAFLACKLSRHKPKTILLVQNTLFPPVGRRIQWPGRNLLSRIILRGATKIVALSKGVMDDIEGLDAKLKRKIVQIANIGVPLPIETPGEKTARTYTESSNANGQIQFIACGRLAEQKGFDLLLRSFAVVSKNLDSVLHIVGDGPLKQNLRILAANLGLKDNVIFHGHLSSPMEVFQKADIFVLSSLWEGFANVIVEAMSQGLPVIATDCSHGPGEILLNGKFGLLVPPNDEVALADAMISLARDRKLQAKLSTVGRIRSMHYSTDKICDEWEKLLEDR
jgi:glycosyltransferase involved in cell wall biosynthesis